MAIRAALHLQIPQPCHEAWDAMTPTATGRHCASCEKVVVDFTRMTDGEVVAWFSQHAGQPTCGRVSAHQLNRALFPAAHRAPVWHRWALATLLVFGGQAATSTDAHAQTASKVQPVRAKAPKASIKPQNLKLLTLRQPALQQNQLPPIMQEINLPADVIECVEMRIAGTVSGAYYTPEFAQPTKLSYKSLMEGEPLPFPQVR